MLTLAFNIQATRAKPKTWIVDDDGPADFHTIQEAINKANPNDTIFVRNGTYYENVVINKTISLIGENNEATIVDANMQGIVIHVAWNVSANITKFLIRNGETGLEFSTRTKCVLRNNSFENNRYSIEFSSLAWDSKKPEYGGLFHDIDYSNTVDGKPIYYWVNEKDKQVPEDAGFVCLVNCTNISVKNLELVGNGIGLIVGWSNNSIIENITTLNNHHGILFMRSYNNKAYNNSILNNDGCGVVLGFSGNNTFEGTSIVGNQYNFGLFGRKLTDFVNYVSLSNTVNGKPIYYVINQKDLVINSSYGELGYLGIVNCTNIVVRNINLSENYQGLLFAYTNNSCVEQANIFNNWMGIFLVCSSNNLIDNNIIADNEDGLCLMGLVEHFHGEYVPTTENFVVGNTFQNNIWGIDTIFESTFNNRIYHNNFVNSTRRHTVVRFRSKNIWDNGYPSGGNYWSDYVGVDVKNGSNQDLPGSDGIGDTPYIIDADNRDRYPLMFPFGAPPSPTYNLTITATVGGTTDPAPGTYSYTENSTVEVTATPEAGYLFDHWELDSVDVGSANPYNVLMDQNHTLKAVFAAIPPPLSASISPLSASILVGQSVTFTSTVSGGYPPYTYRWYLNGAPVSGATADTWTFTPTTSGIFYVYLKVTDDKDNTAQSDTARITVSAVPVGGYSISIQQPTTTKPATPYIALLTILTTIFTTIKRKTKKKTKM